MTVHLTNEIGASVDEDSLASIAGMVLEAEGYPSSVEVSVFLVSDSEMAEHNRGFMGREGPTDVLAFPLETPVPGEPLLPAPEGPPLLLGDVFIAPEHVARQAERLEVTFDSEMALMVVHGVLHLMGYDHHADSDAELMEAVEDRILSRVGLERQR